MPIDYSKYPSNWKTEIVPRILKRAGNRCEMCGVSNGEWLKSVKLYIRHNGQYKWRTIWLSNQSDFIRIKHLARFVKTVRVVLTVAHLDHDEINHNITDDRLKAMCQYCHLNYDAKEKYRRAYDRGEVYVQPSRG